MLHNKRGFALPSVLIASLVMLAVLVTALQTVSVSRGSLDSQFYNKLAQQAANAGIIRASSCLEDNSHEVTWGASVLRPNTSCNGGAICTDNANCFVLQEDAYRTRFEVYPPVADGSGVQTVTSRGFVELLRSSDGAVWKTYTYDANMRAGGAVGFDHVVFGYTTTGAFFGTVNGDGSFKTLGWNSTYYQLGNGTETDTLTPTDFILPGTEKAVAGYSNFLSVGYNMFVKTDAGNVYGAGDNSFGQLGNNSVGGRLSTPVRFQLPIGDNVVKSVAVGGRATFVTTENNNIYAAGYCDDGMLGTNYTISGCTDRGVPARVALPTPNVADPNTIPTDNVAIDSESVFIRMSGGRVYGWGAGHHGELAQGNYASSSIPVKIGTYGDPGQPKAVQVVYDGVTVFILDDNGAIKSAGWNQFGQSGTRVLELKAGAPSTLNKCIGASGTSVILANCNDSFSAGQKFILEDIPAEGYYPGYGRLKNLYTGRCLAQNGGTSATGLIYTTCSNTAYGPQDWEFYYDRWLYKTSTGLSLRRNSTSTAVYLSGPRTEADEFKFVAANSSLVYWNPPSALTGKIIKIHTDQSSLHVLTDTGEVWSTGLGSRGQHGDGTSNYTNAEARKFNLPSGVEAVDIYEANAGTPTSSYQNLFVIGDNGRVYGAGSNNYGQLGNGSTAAIASSPVAMNVIDGTTIRALSVQTGLGTTVVLASGNKVYTVGNNSHGQLGDGTTTPSSTPRLNKYTNIFPPDLY